MLGVALSVLGSVRSLQAESGPPRAGELVAICGDSITEQRGYAAFMTAYLLACQPAPSLETIKFGYSGERAPPFLARLEKDVLPFHANIATICYGMNDGDYAAPNSEAIATYRRAINEIARTFKRAGYRQVVLGSPGVVDPDTFRKEVGAAVYNETLARLTEVAQAVAREQGVTFADVHHVMLDAMMKAKTRFGAAYHVAGKDGMHPAQNGSLVMAYAFLKALGCDGDIGTITVDAGHGTASATPGHRIVAVAGGTVTVESRKYPFCVYGDAKDPDATAGIVEFIPFHQDLNRFTLRVTHSPAAALRVTWGGTQRTFSAAQLERGVNLAAEFPTNPFSEPFARVLAAVQRRDAFEVIALRRVWNPLSGFDAVAPEEGARVRAIRQLLVEMVEHERHLTRAELVPVTHTISIEPER